MKKSKIGISLVLLYLIAIIIIVINVKSCVGLYCGIGLLIAIMPWVFLFQGIFRDSIFLYLFLIILNSAIIYSFGWLISYGIHKTKLK